jgi:CRP-like cAMP-binding protein
VAFPEDARLAHTSSSLELTQALVSKHEKKTGETRRRRDTRRCGAEAAEVYDATKRVDRVAAVDTFGNARVREDERDRVKEYEKDGGKGKEKDHEKDGEGIPETSSDDRMNASSRSFEPERRRSENARAFKAPRKSPPLGWSVAWVQAHRRDEDDAARATARARDEREAAGALARRAAKQKAEEKASKKSWYARTTFREAYDKVKKALRLRSACACARATLCATEIARRAALESTKRDEDSAARRDATIDSNILLSDFFTESKPETEKTIRNLFFENFARAGDVLSDASPSESPGVADTSALCVIERGRVEIRVLEEESPLETDALETDDEDETTSNVFNVFGKTRLVATLSRGQAFSRRRAALASLFGAPTNTRVVVASSGGTREDDEDAMSEGSNGDIDGDDDACVFWELTDPAAFAATALSLLRRRAVFESLWSSVPLFRDLPVTARAFFVDATWRETKHPGERFCVENEPCDALRVVERGRAFAHRLEANAETETETRLENSSGVVSKTPKPSRARQVIVEEYSVGDFFIGGALRHAGFVADATVTARDVTSTLAMSRRAFRDATRGVANFGGGFESPRTKTSRAPARGPAVFANDEDASVTTGSVTTEERVWKTNEERVWKTIENRAPAEKSRTRRFLLSALLRTAPFLAVGRSVAADAEAAVKRMRPRRVRVGDSLFRVNDQFTAAYVVQRGTLWLVGDDHGGELGDEHVEIPEDEDARTRASEAPAAAAAHAHRAPGAGSARRVIAELAAGDSCGFAAVAHPTLGASWTCSAIAAASPDSPGSWVTVWELRSDDFFSTAGDAMDAKRDRFDALLAHSTCAALRGLTSRRRLRAADALEEATYESGDVIVARGAPATDGMYVVMSGTATEESSGVSMYASFPASGIERGARRSRVSGSRNPAIGNEGSARSLNAPRSSTPAARTTLTRGDVFGTDGVFDGGLRDRTVTAGGRRGAVVRCAVWRPAALAQLGFLRSVLEADSKLF